jgi:hypothetical protein
MSTLPGLPPVTTGTSYVVPAREREYAYELGVCAHYITHLRAKWMREDVARRVARSHTPSTVIQHHNVGAMVAMVALAVEVGWV